MMFFSEADDEVLVEQVGKHPALYNLTHEFYKDQKTKDRTWAQISEIVGKPVHQCKKRWRNIKDTWDRKNKRKLDPTVNTSATSPTVKRRKWALDNKLFFLRSLEEERGSHFLSSFIPPQEGEVDSHLLGDEQNSTATQYSTEMPTPSDTFPQFPTTTLREMKRQHFDSDSEDDVDLFFRSLAKSVKKLAPPLQRRAKLGTLNIVTKLESEMWRAVEQASSNGCNPHVYSSSSEAHSDAAD